MKNLTKSVSIVLMAAVLSLALIGCQSTAPVDSVPEIVVPVPAPAAEAPAPAPVVEEEVAAPAAETAFTHSSGEENAKSNATASSISVLEEGTNIDFKKWISKEDKMR